MRNLPPFARASRHPAGPDYADYEQPDGSEFWRARSQIVTMWRQVTIPLDVAAMNSVQQITGDFIFCDQSSTGNINLEFNNQTNAEGGAFQVSAGWLHRGPFVLAKMGWAAQSGKFVKLLYATGLEAYPGLTGLAISGTVNTSEQGLAYGASWNNLGATVANTPLQLVAPGANVNGILLQSASMMGRNAAGATMAFIAKSSAPANAGDGDVLLSPEQIMDGGISAGASLKRAITIASGKGLYYISTAALTVGNNQQSALYTIL